MGVALALPSVAQMRPVQQKTECDSNYTYIQYIHTAAISGVSGAGIYSAFT